ncbi:hypothetical protein [Erythrobacter donghaensis]|uniref:hypothetical protein n=1 Tax=Erythrobacter donghaensis TaxID=267135 RepID=UPI00117D5714|nr:hypothetical protein [Erythrobacter donghaensis]
MAPLSACVVLAACGGAVAADERSTYVSKIESCFEKVAPDGKVDRAQADVAVAKCQGPIEAYSRYNVQQMFGRKLDENDEEMTTVSRIHQNALKDFAIRKLTTGEGNWQ